MATKSTVFCTSGKDLVKKATLEESRGFGPYDVRAGRANVFFQRRLSLSLSLSSEICSKSSLALYVIYKFTAERSSSEMFRGGRRASSHDYEHIV